MRIVKEAIERKMEIIDTAEKLFLKNSYAKTTVNDILTELNIAKGTFYHYFKSKEEVLDAIVTRNRDIAVSRAEQIVKRQDLQPDEKLMHAFLAMRMDDRVSPDILDELHKNENALLHQKTLHQIVTAMAPVLAQVVQEGMEKSGWHSRFPLQDMQIFLAAALTLTDEGIFDLPAEEQMTLMAALIAVLEKMLDVPKDSFLQLFSQYHDG